MTNSNNDLEYCKNVKISNQYANLGITEKGNLYQVCSLKEKFDITDFYNVVSISLLYSAGSKYSNCGSLIINPGNLILYFESIVEQQENTIVRYSIIYK